MKQEDIQVTIVMATYLGEPYVRRQIESIQNQSHRNWRLVVRDDDSPDLTASIVSEMASGDSRIALMADGKGHLGFCQNFNQLLLASAGRCYVMCSDQDDIWFDDKIEVTLGAMLESEHDSPARPTLVFTDYMIVDETGSAIAASNPVIDNIRRLRRFDLHSLLGYNYVWGCTTMVNGALLDAALPMPPEAESHDYWLALTASAVGEIAFVDRPTMFYRRHRHAATGGSDVNSWSSRLQRHLLTPRDLARTVAGTERQMATLNDVLRSRGHEDPLLRRYVEAIRSRRVAKVWRLRRLRIRRQGLGQELAYYAHTLLGS